ncbi:bromodomain-containing protein 7-like isoform X1 [Amphibalanus amphitrite]|uniref:bromodomain-containing protein 7-like isoform X1 n=2 Tax=Amphibalanus amphitrite TaxID=1232801 RepID=UPI001C919C20|nr:bromodomain-containing protein 7-like isoform X1 [Amphibalanus amphitrite]XP_043211203.1 bromodomain-containing protein 7-like isoform X1 [Amphibalanus amphitrite]
MGKEKKHKRHKSDRRETYEADLPGGRPLAGPSSGLRLVLKVGVTPEHEPSPATPPPSVVAPLRLSMAAITEAETHRKEKKHKKKKKKDKDRDREHRERHRSKKERRHAESVHPASTEDSASRLSSSTEPFSQSTASSPEPASVPPPAPAAETDLWRPPGPLSEPASSHPSAHRHSSEPRHGEDHQMERELPPSDDQEGELEPGYDDTAEVGPRGYEPGPEDGLGRSHSAGRDHELIHSRARRHSSGHGYDRSQGHGLSPGYDRNRTPDEPPYEPPHRGAQSDSAYPSEGHSSAPYDASEAAPYHPGYPADHPQQDLQPPKNSLQKFLEYLLRGLEKRDTQRFFRAPVTDLQAPGYSNVIRHPMDFSTMREKVQANMYATVAEFQNDFRLMCTNAMAYNRSDTIYFKAGKRLLHMGTKMMMPEKLMSLRTVVPAMLDLGPEVLGFEVLPPPLPASAAPQGAHITSQHFSAPEPVDEEAEAAAILKQAQEAARKAAEKVAKSKKAPQLGFLRRQPDGSTTMSVLTPAAAAESAEEPPDKTFSLGVMTGRFSHGSPYLAGFREDRRNRAKPVRPVNHGAYGSFGPWYDSGSATISKEESELLAQTYGGETAQQYAQSVRQFTEGCQLATQMVDNLLDILTEGRHRHARYRIDQLRHVAGEERAVNFALATAVPTLAAPPGPPVDVAALRSLSELGIDVRFVDAIEEEERRYKDAQARLQHTSEMLVSLSEMQRRRLSRAPESGPAAPSQKETELAEALASSLTWMVRQNPPGDVAATGAVRKALGVGPVAAASPDNPSSHEEVDVEAVSAAATPEVR